MWFRNSPSDGLRPLVVVAVLGGIVARRALRRLLFLEVRTSRSASPPSLEPDHRHRAPDRHFLPAERALRPIQRRYGEVAHEPAPGGRATFASASTGSRPPTASISRSTRTSSWRWSAPTARARPRFLMCAPAISAEYGEVTFDGESHHHLSPRTITRRGIARAFQIPQLFTRQP